MDSPLVCGESMMQVGDIVKYRNDRSWIPPIKGVWLVINMERDTITWSHHRDDDGEDKYATLKKGSNTRYTHISHLKKV